MNSLPSAAPAAQEKILLKIGIGTQIRVRGLRWDAQWEFDCPTAIIAPVYRFHEDGCSLEHAVESLLIDACINGQLKSHDPHFWDSFRGWSPAYLRRKFYRRGVEHVDLLVTFDLDEDGELTWREREYPKRGQICPQIDQSLVEEE